MNLAEERLKVQLAEISAAHLTIECKITTWWIIPFRIIFQDSHNFHLDLTIPKVKLKGLGISDKKIIPRKTNRRNKWLFPTEFRLFRRTENSRNSFRTLRGRENNSEFRSQFGMHFLPRNNGNRSESIPRSFFGTKFRSQNYKWIQFYRACFLSIAGKKFLLPGVGNTGEEGGAERGYINPASHPTTSLEKLNSCHRIPETFFVSLT